MPDGMNDNNNSKRYIERKCAVNIYRWHNAFMMFPEDPQNQYKRWITEISSTEEQTLLLTKRKTNGRRSENPWSAGKCDNDCIE